MAKGKPRKMTKADQQTIARILKYIKKYLHLVICSIILAAVTVVLTLYLPILTGRAVDTIVGKGDIDWEKLFETLKLMAILIVMTALAQWFMNHINNIVTFRVVEDIRTKAFNHVEKLPISYLDKHPAGDLTSRIITDIDQFSQGLLMGFTQLFTGVLTILGTLGFMFYIEPVITVLVIVLTPLSFMVASAIAKHTYSLFKRQSESRGNITAFTEEMLGNLKVVKAFSHEKKAQEQFEDINETLSDYSFKAVFVSSLVNPATRCVNNIVYAAVGVSGAFMAIKTLITVGELVSFLSYANQYTKPFNEISGVVTELQNAIASAARVFEIIDEEPMVPDAKDAVVLGGNGEELEGKIDIDHLWFSYDKTKKLLTDINIHVNPGETVAIVGPTGCGKSTLINLLMRFYEPDEGGIKVDGFDNREVTRESLRNNFGMVLQETWLKATTIRRNIAYGKPDATMEEIVEAAKKAHCDGFIRRLPQGYDTVLGEDGGSLSQGQKQLLCIARLMLRLPPMLILDEATSSIDTRTELHIQHAFDRMMEGRTTFIVAHRLSTIRNADLILVLKDGNIIEQGRHEELLSKGGFYSTLYNSQFAAS
ncbi:ABC transporter ATP-binding protein [Oribacterium sp. WCC10]|uniref:ABC transporter ATP-binding protein n=1 Tax=Oribacterium sp. WCC10 TaxID=1855343 RepID=UPI0008ECEC11|nr:ABC transporter ATP-binding protein [Oribacterium sp. WCC10]SFG06574.1 ATP-binding cassette, subfamily B [Oribacterium sp. WCC10]